MMGKGEVQLSLLCGPAVARRTDPETSKVAARTIERGRANSHRAKCLVAVKFGGGLTAGEVAEATGILCHAVGKRLPELHRAGLIQPKETRTCNVQGTMMRVWYPA